MKRFKKRTFYPIIIITQLFVFLNLFLVGCDSKAIMFLLCSRSNAQRQKISLAYKTMHGRVGFTLVVRLFPKAIWK